jgi:predicted acetyltransferase
MAMIARAFDGGRDAKAVAVILNRSFGDWSPEGHLPGLMRIKKSDCKNHRVVEDDGRVVAYLHVVSRDIQIGRAILHAGGIAGVCTDPATRMKGYAKLLMEDAIEFMRKEGYEYTLLYGIPNFYHKFGYEVVMARHNVTIAQHEIPQTVTGLRRSAMTEKDAPAALALYRGETRFRDGNVVRKKMRVRKASFKLTDTRGRMRAYAMWTGQDGSMTVHEGVARDAEAGRELLAALKAVAWREGLDHINVRCPFGYHLTDAIRPLNSAYHRTNTYRKGAMGRVLDLAAVARKMEPEWAHLVGRSEYAHKSGGVSVRIGDETLEIRFSPGRLTARVGRGKAGSSVAAESFSQILFGYTGVGQLAAAGGTGVGRGSARLLEVLFPERTSFLFATDEF